jgi:hypothetical protein
MTVKDPSRRELTEVARLIASKSRLDVSYSKDFTRISLIYTFSAKRAPESHAELFKQAVISKDFDKFSTVLRNMGNDLTCKKATIQDLDASFIIPTLKYINEVFRDDRLRER